MRVSTSIPETPEQELKRLRKENERLRMEREILKNYRALRHGLLARNSSSRNVTASKGSGRPLFGASSPSRKHGPGVAADLRLVTLRRSRLGK